MARNTTLYSQASHSVIVDGLAIEDFGDGDDAIAFEIIGDAATVTRGLDTNKPSAGGRRPGNLRVRLKPTSPSIERLEELARQQDNGNPRTFRVTVVTGVSDVLSLRGCLIQAAGFNTGGPVMQLREYTFVGSEYDLRG
jgi:hypothetical protein